MKTDKNDGFGETGDGFDTTAVDLEDTGDGFADELEDFRRRVEANRSNGHSNYAGDKNVYENNVAEAADDGYYEELSREYGEEFANRLVQRFKNGWTEWDIRDGVLRRYGGNIKRVIIPDGVTEIADGAFATNEYLEEVTLPDTVTKLGARAFGWCKNLTKINLPDGVTEIGERAFVDCGYLKKVKPGGNLQVIDNSAFWLCSNLEEIEIPESVKRIGDYAFCECIRLFHAVIDNAETSIGKYAFQNCRFWGIHLGDNITSIGEGAFSGSGVVKLTIPASVKTMGKKVFEGCEQLHWVQCMAESKPEGWDENWDKNSLAKGGRVKAVWNWGFTNGVIKYYDKSEFCMDGSKLKKYTGDGVNAVIPDGVTTVDSGAFRDCESIEKLTVPVSVNRFCDDVFSITCKIKAVYYKGSLKQWKQIAFDSRCDNLNEFAEEIYIKDKRIK